jgi:3-methyl-2-oxobutanoate hydroxymethyltransferase
VANGASSALIVADLPFLTYQTCVADAVRNAGRLVQQGRATAVKLEGGVALAETVRAIVNAGIPVMGHVGLLPQSVHMLGGFRAVGKTDQEAEQILRDVKALEQAGAFAIVLECLSADLATRVTKEVSIPTIGIGSGPYCDGQVLVSYDAFGLYQGFVPRFVKQFADLGAAMTDAARSYIDEVRNGAFPSA